LRDAFVTLLPEVEGDLTELYASAKVVIAPLFEGIGVARKTLEALALGRAAVVTPLAARGCDETADACAVLDMRAQPRLTADAILQLLSSPERRTALEQTAMACARRSLSRERYFSAVDRVLTSLGIAAGQPLAA
jgi:glycosyltransferase involved in cell wall biosynthesis